jgi:hypothetical protein
VGASPRIANKGNYEAAKRRRSKTPWRRRYAASIACDPWLRGLAPPALLRRPFGTCVETNDTRSVGSLDSGIIQTDYLSGRWKKSATTVATPADRVSSGNSNCATNSKSIASSRSGSISASTLVRLWRICRTGGFRRKPSKCHIPTPCNPSQCTTGRIPRNPHSVAQTTAASMADNG